MGKFVKKGCINQPNELLNTKNPEDQVNELLNTELNDEDSSGQDALEKKCPVCGQGVHIGIKKESEILSKLDPKERKDAMVNALFKLVFIGIAFAVFFMDFIKKKLKVDLKCIQQRADSVRKSADELNGVLILPAIGFKRKVLVGDAGEIGKHFGNFFGNARNSKGDHVFNFKETEIARWISASFVLVNCEEFTFSSLLASLAVGRTSGDKPVKKSHK